MLPELGYNTSTAHHDHTASNTPEVMLLDASLFNDLDKGVE